MTTHTIDDARKAVAEVRLENLTKLSDHPIKECLGDEELITALVSAGFVRLKDLYGGLGSLVFLKASPYGEAVRKELMESGFPDPFSCS